MICTKCHLEKPDTDFRAQKDRNGQRRANCKKCENARMRDYRSRNLEPMRAHDNRRYRTKNRWPTHLKRKYDLTPFQFLEMLADQKGVCAICGTDKPGGRSSEFNVDHCHKTGKIRGLLCTRCNHMLGYAKDRTETLHSAILYLEKASG